MRMNRLRMIEAVLIALLTCLFLSISYGGLRSLSKSHLPGDKMNQGPQ